MPSLDPSFRPLEYWKPPKAVRHHTRAKSSAIFSAGGAIRSFTSNHSAKGEKSLATKTTTKIEIEEMSFWPKNQYSGVNMVSRGQPPAYRIDDGDTLNPRWYDVREWGKKIWIRIGVAIIIIVIVVAVVVAVVEVEKANRYPDYSALSYSLSETYSGTGFFDQFDYFTGYDPTSGFVHYVPSAQAESLNLTYAGASSAVLRVDTSVTADSVPNASTGRFSVRVSSKNQYGLNSLFIFDVIHTPTGCATWPALWLVGSNWPYNGEIDVMEAVNVVSNAQNQISLHTSPGCSMGVKRKETGTPLQNSCVNTTNGNAGCGVHAPTSIASFGDDFNSNGGGVMAVELRAAGIRLWQFPRASIPSDVTSGTPDPSTWGEATADFPNTDCNIETHFENQSIIANIDLCGDWAGATGVYDVSCPGTCTDYVANNATAFTDSYWEFGAFSVYSGS